MKTFYIVAIGPVNKSNGGVLQHGQVLCSAELSINETDRKQLSDMLGCAFMDIVDKTTYEKDYQEQK